MMDFLIIHSTNITLGVWVVVSALIVLRYFELSFMKRVPWWSLVVFVVLINILYVVFLGVGQYAMWSANEFTRAFLTEPLAGDVPLPWILESFRGWFSGPLGYFSFYVLGRFVWSLLILFGVALLAYALLVIRKHYRPSNFKEGDIGAIVLAVLVSGWPGVIVLIPLGFMIAVFVALIAKIFYGIERTYLPPAFLVAAPIAMVFGTEILKALNLYTLLKL